MSSDPGFVDDLIAGITVVLYIFVGFVGITLIVVISYVVRGSHSIHSSERLPGAFDDSEQFFEEEATALELMDDRSKQSYSMAKRWVEHNPPNSADTDISSSQYMTIQEKAVAAWEFTSDISQQPTVNVHNRTEIDFRSSPDMCCVQTNSPSPKQKEVYYWETKIYDMAPDTKIAVGLTTKPYPCFRSPGMHRYSVSYESQGIYRSNQPFSGITYGHAWQRGDVIGVGFRTRTGTVFFTHNGRKLDDVAHGMRVNSFPTVGTIGAANSYVNLGQDGFVFIQANVKEWGLAPAQGSLAPPPAYGDQDDSSSLESTQLAAGPSPRSPVGPAGPSRTAANAVRLSSGSSQGSQGSQGSSDTSTAHTQGHVTASYPPSVDRSEPGEAPPYVRRRSSDDAHSSLHSVDIHTPPGSPPPPLPMTGSNNDEPQEDLLPESMDRDTNAENGARIEDVTEDPRETTQQSAAQNDNRTNDQTYEAAGDSSSSDNDDASTIHATSASAVSSASSSSSIDENAHDNA